MVPSPSPSPWGVPSSSPRSPRSSPAACASPAPVNRSPPSQRSMRRCTPASSSNASWRVTMSRLGPRAKWRFTSSRTLRSHALAASLVPSRPSRLAGPAFGIVLSANARPSDRRVARRTTPIAPRPRGSPSSSAASASRRSPSENGSASTSPVTGLDEPGSASDDDDEPPRARGSAAFGAIGETKPRRGATTNRRARDEAGRRATETRKRTKPREAARGVADAPAVAIVPGGGGGGCARRGASGI